MHSEVVLGDYVKIEKCYFHHAEVRVKLSKLSLNRH